jgi:hypothetical protein
VHGHTKTYYFSFDNRKMSSGGNTAYGVGYGDGQTAVRNKIGNKGTVTSNGTYTASSDGWEGYSAITVDVVSSLGSPKVTAIDPDITSSVSVCSTLSNGTSGSYKTLSMSSTTYSPRGVGGTKECVVVKDGSTTVGRYDIQSICNTYKRNGESEGWSDGYEEGYDAGAEWANKQYKQVYTGTLYVNGTISAGNATWYVKK